MTVEKGYEPIICDGVEFIQHSEFSYFTVDCKFCVTIYDSDYVGISVYCAILGVFMGVRRSYCSLDAAMRDVALYVKTGLLDDVIGKKEGDVNAERRTN